MIIRIGKALMLFSISAFFFLVVLNNLLDYKSNFSYIQHVLSMDTTFQSPLLMVRAIQNPIIHHAAYWCIIAWQIVTSILCFIGCLKLIKHRSSPSLIFNSVKGTGVIGLTCGFLLYSFVFITIGGEWFSMWQSKAWNGQIPSHIFMTMIGIVLIFLVIKDE